MKLAEAGLSEPASALSASEGHLVAPLPHPIDILVRLPYDFAHFGEHDVTSLPAINALLRLSPLFSVVFLQSTAALS